ncbi:MAG: SPOR domain-containing protein, partial [Bacteroidota bacterium]
WPAILIFHPEGRLMGRIDGYVAPQTLVSILQKHIRSLEHERRTAYIALVEKQEEAKNMAQLLSDDEVLSPAVAVQDMSLQAQTMRTRGEQKITLLQTVEGMEEYSLKSLPELPNQQPTYGLLLGAHTSYKDLKYQVQKIRKFWRGQIWVYAEESEGNPVYKLAIGAYEDRETAESFAGAIYRFERINASILNLQLLKD